MSTTHSVRSVDETPMFVRQLGPIVFVDLETVHDRIVEIAMIRLAPDEEPQGYVTLLDPGLRNWDTHSKGPTGAQTRLHGITRATVRGQPTLLDIVPAIRSLAAGATLVSHNASFEHRVLGLEMARIGQPWSAPPHLCTLRLARRLYPTRARGYGLTTLASDLQVPLAAQRRTGPDTCMLALVLQRMFQKHGLGDSVMTAVQACTIG
jgi:DNA polymerase-3 subunit epsilon